MKTLAYIILHYGKDYLPYAIESIYPCVDEILILYTPNPSHGSSTNLTCPDSKQDLLVSLDGIDHQNKISWVEGNWNAENQHRNYAHDYARKSGFDMLLLLDFDEVWDTKLCKELIQLTYERKANKCLIWMRHLWRSFNYICDDGMRQERIYYLGSDKGDLIYAPQPVNQVWHFGYARKPIDIEYKISIHGHSGEWLQSKRGWFDSKYMPWPPVSNVHPACADTWTPMPFDKTRLPEIMKKHPYYNLEVI